MSTPVLPHPLHGTAYLVSHGMASFPDLDIVLEGDGVRVILVGSTNIQNGITSSTFATVPDVPVSSFSLDLPVGPNSVLAAHGDLCTHPLIMPTSIVGQNGKLLEQRTKLSVSGCGIRILERKAIGKTVRLRLQAFRAGRISVRGSGLHALTRRLRKAGKVTLNLPLTSSGAAKLRSAGKLKVRLRVGFRSSSSDHETSKALAVVTFHAR